MACGRKKRWYIESGDRTCVLVEGNNHVYLWSPKVFEGKPKLFRNLKTVRKLAADNGGIVRFYNKAKYDVELELPL